MRGRENENEEEEEEEEEQVRRRNSILPLSGNWTERELEMERIHVTVRARPLSAADAKTSPWRISGNSIFIPNHPNKFDFGMFLLSYLTYISVFLANFALLGVFFVYLPWLSILLSFYFADRVFGEDCSTFEVYQARTKEIVASAVRGFNGIFYGIS